MKKVLTLLTVAAFLMVGCAQNKHACGTKQQKKAKHKSMKSGKTPGGSMLSR